MADATSKIKVDISDLKKAMQEAKQATALANSEFKLATAGMQDWSKSADGISAKLKQLKTNVSSQKSVLAEYEKILEDVKKQYGENSDEAVKWQTKVNNQKATVASTEAEIKKLEGGIDDLTETTKESGEGFTVFKGVLANLATQGINLAIDGIKKMGAAMAGLVKDSVAAYAESEQLIGGVQTLFGTQGMTIAQYAQSVGKTVEEVKKKYADLSEAEATVMHNAAEAYKTAGLSANEYMETVTSFSASLIASLDGDTATAAKAADQAITDMADNANKMGSSMESIQNAYQGFAKQNYTMLDNLKLGYGGTKSEMERLLSDAEKLTGKKYNLDNLADVYDAIHAVQNELGITGTTAKEAATTIEGSVASMKSAWHNLVAGMANDDADMKQLIDNFVESVGTAASNVLPRISQSLQGVGALITQLAPIIAEQLPVLIREVTPPLLSSLGELLKAIGNTIIATLPDLLKILFELVGEIGQALLSSLPEILIVVLSMITMLLEELSANLPIVAQAVAAVIPLIVDALIACAPELLKAAIQVYFAMIEAIPVVIVELLKEVPKIVEAIVATMYQLLIELERLEIDLMKKIIKWILDFTAEGRRGAAEFIVNVINYISQLPGQIQAFLNQIISFVVAWASDLIAKGIEAATGFFGGVVDNVKDLPTQIKAFLDDIIAKVKAFAVDLKEKALDAGKGFVTNLVDTVKGLPERFKEIGGNIVEGLWDGINAGWDWLTEKVENLANSLLRAAKNALGISSPSKAFRDIIGKQIPAGIALGIEDNAQAALSSLSALTGQMTSAANVSLSAGAGGMSGGVVNNFYQTNNSPKALSRLEIYRQSKNLLSYAGGF